MTPIRSSRDQRGLTLVELMLVIFIGFIVLLGAGSIYISMEKSFRQSAGKMVGGREATHLSSVLSRGARVASGFMVYDIGDRSQESDPGNGLALLDADGSVMARLEWDPANRTVVDGAGTRVTASTLQNLQFSSDLVSPQTVRFAYRTIDDSHHEIDVESAVALRN